MRSGWSSRSDLAWVPPKAVVPLAERQPQLGGVPASLRGRYTRACTEAQLADEVLEVEGEGYDGDGGAAEAGGGDGGEVEGRDGGGGVVEADADDGGEADGVVVGEVEVEVVEVEVVEVEVEAEVEVEVESEVVHEAEEVMDWALPATLAAASAAEAMPVAAVETATDAAVEAAMETTGKARMEANMEIPKQAPRQALRVPKRPSRSSAKHASSAQPGTSAEPPPQTFVQCDACHQWRLCASAEGLPEVWTCALDPRYGSCSAPNEPEAAALVERDGKRKSGWLFEDTSYAGPAVGTVVWAKQTGSPYWPARVEPPFSNIASPRAGHVLVRFL